MKKYSFLFLLTLALLSSCKKDPVTATDATVNVAFKASFDGDPLQKKKDYLFGVYPVQFTRFTLFITDFSLLKGTEEVRLSEAEFLEFFSESASNNASSVPSYAYKNIPVGEYTGIKIGYGVKPELNAKTPADFPANHALTNENEYWAGWKSYIFSKIEANAEISGTSGDYETFLNYHCGSAENDDVYVSHSFTQPVSITTGSNNLNIEFDLKKAFADGSKMIDISVAENQYTGTSPSDLGLSHKILDNLVTATTIK